MIKQMEISEAVLMKGKGEQLEALERVCDKRHLKGASVDYVIAFLTDYAERNALDVDLCNGVDVLKSYWIARQA